MAPEWDWALAPFTAILIATPCAALEFSDDFADNLLTDLAPVLTLFGERVTMQFLSQSTGWADVIILAMAPLGIMTIIVSAIRVGGPSWLKAAIGRSRENLAVAEVDLMSPTSTEVCELWNGREIVRSMGSAPVREFICISPRPVSGTENSSNGLEEDAFGDVKNYIQKGGAIESLTSDEEPGQSLTSWYPLIHRSPHHVVAREKRNGAPNIALNLQEHPRREAHAAALLAICLQAGVLVYSGFATYYPTLRFPKEKDTPVANYAFPCMATGTLCLVAGLLLCGHVVESSTEERVTKMADGYQAYYIRLQRYATVGDQVFGSFAIFSSDPLSTVVTSRRTVKYEPTILDQVFLAVPDYLLNLASGKRNGSARRNQRRQQHTALLASKTTIGMLFSLCGFIVQFVGLRGLHWSISVFQLGAVLIMTLVRVYIRRDFARPPLACQLPIRFELDWFAMSLMEKDPAPWLNPRSSTTDSTEEEDEDQEKIDNGSESPVSNRSWRVTTTNLTECESLKPQMPRQLSRSHEAITLRKQLGDLTGWRSIAESQAKILKLAIDLTLERLADYYPEGNLIWSVETEFNGVPSQTVNFEVTGAKRGWTAEVLEAALSLWLYSVDQQRRNFHKSHFPNSYPQWAKDMNQGGDETVNLWSGTNTQHLERHLRSLGHDSKQLRRDLQWWTPRDGEPLEVIWIESAEAPQREFRGSFDRTRAGGPGLDIPWFNEDHMEAPVIFYTTHSQRKGIAFDVDDGNPQAGGIITSRVSGTSQMFYTQELFSSFMWALAKTMTARIGGSTDLQVNTVSVDNPLDTFVLSNRILSTLISDIHNTGLASLDTVFSLVIPPLSAMNKLPDATSVITLARQEARPYEQRGDLFTAGKTYVWLVRAMSTFPSTSEVRFKATAVLLQHVKQVEKEMDHWKRCIGLHDVAGFDLLQKHQDMVVKELKADENHEVLMELHSYRNRFTKFEGVAWSKAAPEEKLPSVLGFTAAHAFAKVPRPPYDLSIYLDHINLPDAFGRTPIHYAATLAQSSIIQIVMEIKGRVDAEDLEGKTPLHYACEGVGDGTDKIVRNLLKAGAEINKQARDGSRPIHCAAESGAVETLRTLAEAGAIVDSLDVMGKTPLMLAALGAHKDAVEYLLPISNTSLRDTHGRNVLHMAALSGDTDILGLLAEDMYYSPD
uniref:WGS project CBMG000000000 data, contig CS5907-c003342 n=1 Tax=Fusarium acuminatum CS5907 TaxID=1318461 RepID=A0A090M9X2_9HYPO|nr:unnamed protein product [Fusarium acuminatum CS5907]